MTSVYFRRRPVVRLASLLSLLFATSLGACAQTIITGLKLEVSALLFSPDSKTLAAADESFDLTLWDAASGKAVGKASGLSTRTTRLGWSPDGKTLYGTSGNEWLALDAATGKELKKVPAEMTRTSPRIVALSPDGKLIAAAGQGVVKVWDTATGKALGEYEPHPNYGIVTVCFSPDSRLVCTGSGDKTAKLTEAATGKEVATFTCQRRVVSAEFSPNGQTLFVFDEASVLHQFDVASGKDQPAPPIRSNAKGMAVSPDGKYVALAGASIYLWSVTENRWLQHKLTDTATGATAIAISPDGRLLACADAPERVKIWPLADLLKGN